MKWEVVIGLETHAQLSTASKIFSGASTAFGAAPNTQASAVDIALPGVLPVLNRGAVERAIRFGLAVGATIHRRSVFARKNYFYPDLPKGYQISQYEIPIVQGGSLTIATQDGEKVVRLTRAHLEEDAGKSLHEDYHGMTGIDLNRAGTPLLEIVSEPDMRSAAEAIAYAKRLHALVKWIGICDGNMQEGSFRCDANVSVRREGDPKLGTRCEIKNLNSFRFMQQAIEFEVRRQIELIEDGGAVVQETRLFDPDRVETRPMRSKEDAQDYRYFPDPDLPPLAIDDAWIERVRSEMPELPEAMQARFAAEYALPGAGRRRPHGRSRDRRLFRNRGELLPAPAERSGKLVANWMLGELAAALNRDDRAIGAAPVRAEASRRTAAAHRRRHDLRQDRQGRVRRDVGGRARRRRGCDHRRQRAASRFPTPARSRRSSTTCSPPTPRSSPSSAQARRRRSSRSSARRWPPRRAGPIRRRSTRHSRGSSGGADGTAVDRPESAIGDIQRRRAVSLSAVGAST